MSFHNITGAAGEHFVAAEIMKRQAIASLAPKNTPGIDILASSIDGKRFASIQVKTKNSGRDWVLGSKPIVAHSRLFYVLPDLRADTVDYYIIPSMVIYKVVELAHLEWQKGFKKSGEKRLSNLRVLRNRNLQKMEKYKNKWEILGLWD